MKSEAANLGGISLDISRIPSTIGHKIFETNSSFRVK